MCVHYIISSGAGASLEKLRLECEEIKTLIPRQASQGRDDNEKIEKDLLGKCTCPHLLGLLFWLGANTMTVQTSRPW